MHYEHTAPKWRNIDAMRVWFEQWNAGVDRARRAYAERQDMITRSETRRPERRVVLLRTPPHIQAAILEAYVERGLSLRKTAKVSQSSDCAVRNVLRYHNIPARGLSEAQKLRWSQERESA